MASKFYVYGEDGLTLKVLKNNLGSILLELDGSNPEDCTVFYRPSFGRTRHYGEFDAIIITQNNAYLIESKWDGSSNLQSDLHETQIRRHEILRWYHERWMRETEMDWDSFRAKYNSWFNQRFPKKYIPYAYDDSGRPTKLSSNLRCILEAIGDRKIEDVLFIFYRNIPVKVHQEGFKIIQIKYTLNNYLFLELN